MTLINEAEKAKIRKVRYTTAAVITIVGPALAAALAEGGVSKWAALAVAALGLFTGAGGLAVAANKTGQQVKDGTFDPPATPEPVDPVQSVLGGLQAITAAADAANAARDTVTQGAASVLGLVVDAASAVEKAIADATKR